MQYIINSDFDASEDHGLIRLLHKPTIEGGSIRVTPLGSALADNKPEPSKAKKKKALTRLAQLRGNTTADAVQPQIIRKNPASIARFNSSGQLATVPQHSLSTVWLALTIMVIVTVMIGVYELHPDFARSVMETVSAWM